MTHRDVGGSMRETQGALPAGEVLKDAPTVYRDIFRGSTEAIAVIGLDGRYLQQNEAHRRLLGYADEELAELTPAVHLGEATFNEVARELALAGQFHGQVASRTREGEARWIELSAFAIRGPDGKPLVYVGVKRDITAQRDAEERLATHVRQHQLIAEAGQHALGERNLQHLIDHAAEVVTEGLGVEFCEVLELTPGGTEMVLRGGTGWRRGLVGKARVAIGFDSLAGYTLAEREPVIAENLGVETRFRPPPLLQSHGVVSGMTCIIAASEERIFVKPQGSS
jgi:PAS domain S-box-containing protein